MPGCLGWEPRRALRAFVIAWAVWAFLRRVQARRRQALPDLRPARQRCCLVTGAASGIGLATARLLLRRGWHVGAFDINEAALRAAFGGGGGGGAGVNHVVTYGRLDVTDDASCDAALAAFLAATGGRLDVLFNCAGLLATGPFAELTLQRQLDICRVNIGGVVRLTHKAIPALRATAAESPAGSSAIVTMASLSAVAGIPRHATYSATKAFVYHFTEALRSELASQRIRVADVSVNYVDTNMVRSVDPRHFSAAQRRDVAKRLSRDEVAERVYACIQQASYYDEHFAVRGAGVARAAVDLLRGLGSTLGMNLVARAIDHQGKGAGM